MNTADTIILVDSDYRRRARIAHMLAGEGRHVEPYEGLADLTRDMPDGTVWLVVDEEDLVKSVNEAIATADAPHAIIAFSADPQLRKVVAAMLAGAGDYLAWPATAEELIGAIKAAEISVRPRFTRWQRSVRARERIKRLTRREREILTSVAMGSTNREIGTKLGISHRTVEIHRSNMLTKLEASNSPDAVRIAFDAGLIE
ncbi:MAG: hypothetical protein RIQ46_692 [Pseudomonadota bacterium]|jgi:FixJ family two-component response regulator